jgi:hypothetical protein
MNLFLSIKVKKMDLSSHLISLTWYLLMNHYETMQNVVFVFAKEFSPILSTISIK